MRKLIANCYLLIAICGASAAYADVEMTIYYSPSCPHCHHARDFTSDYLVYEYPTLKVKNINVMDQANRPAFEKVIKDCKFQSGGVPIIVIDEKCFQGFGTADTTGNEFRRTIDAMLTADEKAAADAVRAEFESSPDQFRTQHADRLSAISEQTESAEKKNDNSPIVFWVILGVLVVALGFVVLRKKKK